MWYSNDGCLAGHVCQFEPCHSGVYFVHSTDRGGAVSVKWEVALKMVGGWPS